MKKLVIVCVDDEPIVVNSLKKQLKLNIGDNYMIEVAENGPEALEIIDELIEDGYEIPLVISDYMMPGLKGDQVLVEVYKKNPYTLSILLTGQATVEGVGNALNNSNLYRFIAKPWNANDLVITVQQALKSYKQDKELATKNEELAKLNASLELQVIERTEQLQAALVEVYNAKSLVDKKNEDITASITYAQRIQSAILPLQEDISKKLPEHFIYFNPRDIVSGDFYWYAENETQAIIAAVDCTGHGIPGAFMSLIGNDLLDQIVNVQKVYEPHHILDELKVGVRKILQQETSRNQDGMDIALCVVDTLTAEKRKIRFAGANNPLVYIQNDTLYKVNGDKIIIGGFQNYIDGNHNYNQFELEVDSPTIFYLFSDGYQDQFGGDKNKKFMGKRLRELFLEIHKKPMEEQQSILAQTFDTWKGTNKQIDDVLVIGVRV